MGVRQTIRVLLVKSLVFCGFLAIEHPLHSQGESQDPQDSDEPPPITYSGNERGRFKILFTGEEIGYEDFEISGSSKRFKASSSTELTISREEPEEPPEYLDEEALEEPPPKTPRQPIQPVTFLIRSSLSFNDLFEPETYEVVQDAGPNRMRANVRFLPDRSQVTYHSDDGTDQRKIELKKDVTVLDDNVFHHYLILSKRYDFSQGGIQEFSAFVPQQFLAGGIRISDVGREEIEIGGQTHWLRRLLIDTGELKVNLWLDKDDRLKKLAIPDSEVEAIRQ